MILILKYPIKKLQNEKNLGEFVLHRGWCIKFATGINTKIGRVQKSIDVIKLFFGQNDPPHGRIFWAKRQLDLSYTF